MAGTNPVGAYAETNITTEAPPAWGAQVDANSAVLMRPGDLFAPRPDTTPGMVVWTDPGFVVSVLPNGQQVVTEQPLQGVGIAAAPGAPNNRIDLVVVNAGTGAIAVVTGTPSTTPVAPSAPVGWLQVCLVSVPNGTTSIINSNITDVRAVWGGGVPGVPWAVASGSANAITAAYAPANATLTDGLLLAFRAGNANTGACTFSPDGLAVVNLMKIASGGAVPLVAGDIPGFYAECLVRYSTTYAIWILLNPSAQTYTLTLGEVATVLGQAGGLTTGSLLLGNGGAGVSLLAAGTTGFVLTWNGSAWVAAAPAASWALGGVTTTATNYTIGSGDYGKLLKVTGVCTITLGTPPAGTALRIFIDFGTAGSPVMTHATLSGTMYQAATDGAGTFWMQTVATQNVYPGAYMDCVYDGTAWLVAYIRLPYDNAGVGGGGGGGGGGECFVAGQMVTMSDGSLVAIENVQPGDLIKGAAGETNKVIGIAYSAVRNRVMWNINGDHLTTADHPHISADRKGFHSLNPSDIEAYWGNAENVVHEHGVIAPRVNVGLTKGRVTPLIVGAILLGTAGGRVVSTIKPVAYHPATPLYNLVVGGSHTFFVDGYCVTGWPDEADFDYGAWAPRTATA